MIQLPLLMAAIALAGAPVRGDEPQIRFLSPRHLATVVGPTAIEIDVMLPRGATIERVELEIDGDPLTTLTRKPWTAEWDAGDASRGHHLSAEVFLTDGSSARAVIRTSPLRINLFEEVGFVNLYARVRDSRGDYINGLEKKDFKVLENGVEQEIRQFSTRRKPLRVSIVIDTSLTMEGRKLDKAKRAALDFLGVLQPGDEGIVISFSDEVRVAQEVTTDKQMLAKAIESTRAFGGTALYDAVYRGASKLKGFDGRRVLVLLSDGRDEAKSGLEPGSLHTLEESLEESLRSEAMVFAIGLGRDLQYQTDFYGRQTVADVLRRMADATGGRALISSGASELRRSFKDVAEDLRNQYLLAYLSNDEKKDGSWREIQALTPGRDLEVITRSGYYAPNEAEILDR